MILDDDDDDDDDVAIVFVCSPSCCVYPAKLLCTMRAGSPRRPKFAYDPAARPSRVPPGPPVYPPGRWEDESSGPSPAWGDSRGWVSWNAAASSDRLH